MSLNVRASGRTLSSGFLLSTLLFSTCAPPQDAESPVESAKEPIVLTGFNVLTRQYGNDRVGANLFETTLTTTNVDTARFGRLYQLPVGEAVYAGILYASNLAIAGGTHNVIFVATMNNTVYAFDAD